MLKVIVQDNQDYIDYLRGNVIFLYHFKYRFLHGAVPSKIFSKIRWCCPKL